MANSSDDFLFKKESYCIRGAVFEVYKELGCGFLESVYQECLEQEFSRQQISFVSQPELELFYKGRKLKQTFRPDFICYGKIIVEIKAMKEVSKAHHAQVYNYLKATGLRLGFLANFGDYPVAKVTRFIK